MSHNIGLISIKLITNQMQTFKLVVQTELNKQAVHTFIKRALPLNNHLICKPHFE